MGRTKFSTALSLALLKNVRYKHPTKGNGYMYYSHFFSMQTNNKETSRNFFDVSWNNEDKKWEKQNFSKALSLALLKNVRYKHHTKGNGKTTLLMHKTCLFNYDGRIYIQVEAVVIGSPLGPVLAIIFMTKLEIAMTPSLGNYLQNWKRFVDDTFAFVLHDKMKVSIKGNLGKVLLITTYTKETV